MPLTMKREMWAEYGEYNVIKRMLTYQKNKNTEKNTQKKIPLYIIL